MTVLPPAWWVSHERVEAPGSGQSLPESALGRRLLLVTSDGDTVFPAQGSSQMPALSRDRWAQPRAVRGKGR